MPFPANSCGFSWVSWGLKNDELGLAGQAGFSKLMSWVLKNYELGIAGLAGFEKIKVSFS